MTGTSILVVDDEAIAAESLRAILRGIGYTDVRVALSGAEVMAAVAERTPGLILMDINLGHDDDGVVVADRVRLEHDLPIVFVTAYADPATVARAKVTHPLGYIVKPVEARNVQVVVEIALHNHQLDARIRRSQRDLRRANERLDMAVRTTGAAVWEWVVPTGETRFSERWAAIVGYTLEELAPVSIDTWARLCHPDDLERSNELVARCFRRETEVYDCECRLRHKDGHWIWVLDVGQVVEWNPDGTPLLMLGAHIDITQHKQRAENALALERRLLHSQKLDSLGMLASGVAHRFNNLLTALLGNTELALMQVPEHSAARESLREIRESARQGAELSNLILAYTGRRHVVVETIDLGALVRQMAPLLEAVMPTAVALVIDGAATVPLLKADGTQVRQILTTLVSNAAEAIGAPGGRVTVTVGVGERSGADLDQMHASDGATPGTFAFIEVSDTGCGMSPETVARLFDPFFSTKFIGRGLSLSAVHGIVRSHRGAIDVTTSPGAGTTMRVWFPVTGVAHDVSV